jgi:peptide/nickel transport system ATP-binding protein
VNLYPLLTLDGVSACVYNAGRRGCFHYLHDISLSVQRGEVLGLVGESGSGKTRLAHLILGTLFDLPGVLSGRVTYHDRNAVHQTGPDQPLGGDGLRDMRGAIRQGLAQCRIRERILKPLRGRMMGCIPQGAKTALNPYRTVRRQVELSLARGGVPPAERSERLAHILAVLNLDQVADSHPFSLSGGQASRAAIALEIAQGTDLLVADEPTTGVDGPYQLKVLQLLREYIDQHRGDLNRAKSLVMITHQIELLRHFADRVAVMYCGEILEVFPNLRRGENSARRPHHPYTRMLLDMASGHSSQTSVGIDGIMPSMYEPREGCVFRSRCGRRTPACAQGRIPIRTLPDGGWIRCGEDLT